MLSVTANSNKVFLFDCGIEIPRYLANIELREISKFIFKFLEIAEGFDFIYRIYVYMFM